MHQAGLFCACTRHVWLECCFLFVGLQLMVVASFHSGYRCNCVRGPKAHSSIDYFEYFLAGDTGESRHST